MSREQALALGRVLWDIAKKLRGSMDPDQFRDYMLGFIFFKYLSDNYEKQLKSTLLIYDEYDSLGEFYERFTSDEEVEMFEKEALKTVGYIIKPSDLWSTFALNASNEKYILDDLIQTFKNIESSTYGEESSEDIGGLFHEVDLNSIKLGRETKERNKLICEIIHILDTNLSSHSISSDDLGDAYEYLISEFAASSGKKAGEFYTPREVSTILSKIVTLDTQNPTQGKKKKLKSIYDPTCGSGSLLFNVYQEIGKKVDKIYGQEKNLTTYNLARMNLLLHNIKHDKFHINHADTLLRPALDSKTKIEAIVANPPFSLKWDSSTVVSDDRFRGYGLPPQSTADYAFILHMIFHLAENGTCAVVVPHGVLFRGGSEGKIRESILTKGESKTGYLDAVIGLPSNLFYSTGIPVCILVFKKCRYSDDILFIDASKSFEKEKKQNVLLNEHIDKIIDTYQYRKEIKKYSKKISLGEIENNEYNLNIPRYIDSLEDEEILNTETIVEEIKDIDKKLATNYAVIKKFCKELNVSFW